MYQHGKSQFSNFLTASILVALLAPVGHATLLPGDFETHRTIANSGTNTGNGSFETGAIGGWNNTSLGLTFTVVTTSPPGPADGTYLGQKVGTNATAGTTSIAGRIDKPARNLAGFTLDDGDVLRILIDFARPANQGFTSVTLVLQPKSGNTDVGSSFTLPSLSLSGTDQWFSYAHDFLLTDITATYNGFDLQMTFRASGVPSGAIRTGYVDNLSFTQGFMIIPEPATVFLVGIAGLLLWGRRLSKPTR
ncbi:MAG: hypothetical protein PCFJNLEI_01664 [Verrucomicrobiae bacterium]|nr:hypothetical protein [Verrucomicrobiae bacterium]